MRPESPHHPTLEISLPVPAYHPQLRTPPTTLPKRPRPKRIRTPPIPYPLQPLPIQPLQIRHHLRALLNPPFLYAAPHLPCNAPDKGPLTQAEPSPAPSPHLVQAVASLPPAHSSTPTKSQAQAAPARNSSPQTISIGPYPTISILIPLQSSPHPGRRRKKKRRNLSRGVYRARRRPSFFPPAGARGTVDVQQTNSFQTV